MTAAGRFRIGLVTSSEQKLRDYFPTVVEPGFVPTEPPFVPDDQILVDELRRHGHHCEGVVWGCDVAELPRRLDVLVVRSPWDYMDSDTNRSRFLRWLADVATTSLRIENEPRVMLWLMDKKYLNDLAAVGVPVVPTMVVAAGERFDLRKAFAEQGPLIIKPAVSGAGVGLVFLQVAREAADFQTPFEERCRTQAQLVQPFMPEVQTAGEWSLVYLDGHYSHAALKRPSAGQIMVHAERGGSLDFAEPPDEVRAAADLASSRIAAAFAVRHPGEALLSPPLYLRIDILPVATGPLLSECEGVEPELFFRSRPGSERVFRLALEARLLHDKADVQP
jgi:glutathione synthase/RimK-type ligase-like ATP-grasp enzyme